MELIFELIFEVFLDLFVDESIEGLTKHKYPKPILVIMAIFLVIVILGTIGGIAIIGICSIKKNVVGGVVLFIIAGLLFFLFIMENKKSM